MLSDEERAVLKTAKENFGLTSAEQKILVNLIEKQSKEIEHQKEKRENQKKELAILNAKQVEFNKLVNTVNSYKGQFKRQQKEIEELKEDKYGLEEEVQMQAKNIMLCEEALCEMQDKIKAKIEEVDYKMIAHQDVREAVKQALQSLLEKE